MLIKAIVLEPWRTNACVESSVSLGPHVAVCAVEHVDLNSGIMASEKRHHTVIDDAGQGLR